MWNQMHTVGYAEILATIMDIMAPNQIKLVSIQLLGVFPAFEYTLDGLGPLLWFLMFV